MLSSTVKPSIYVYGYLPIFFSLPTYVLLPYLFFRGLSFYLSINQCISLSIYLYIYLEYNNCFTLWSWWPYTVSSGEFSPTLLRGAVDSAVLCYLSIYPSIYLSTYLSIIYSSIYLSDLSLTMSDCLFTTFSRLVCLSCLAVLCSDSPS